MIHLTDSISLIEVPEDAELFNIVDARITYWYKGFPKVKYDLPEDSYTILGTIRNGKPDFDVEPYVDAKQVPYFNMDEGQGEDTVYWDYVHSRNTLFSATESFTSLLQSKQVDVTKHYLALHKA